MLELTKQELAVIMAIREHLYNEDDLILKWDRKRHIIKIYIRDLRRL
ncbi:MAG: hypothetical protein K6G88_11915 [Lachnospiraceae bacterium]|nr:hypothetical protein [Lachnospiraceae bacterium]